MSSSVYYSVYYTELTNNEKVQKLSETDTSQKSCHARKDGLHCFLDAQHRGLGTQHVHRHEDGRLEAFRTD